MKKYKIVLSIECEDEIEDLDDILDGSWLYDEEFQGAIIKSKIMEVK